MKRNLLSYSRFKLQLANCNNIENKKRPDLHYSQNKIRLVNRDTGEIVMTTVKENSLNSLNVNGYLKAGEYLMKFF